jgi:hypothetical protein
MSHSLTGDSRSNRFDVRRLREYAAKLAKAKARLATVRSIRTALF